MGSKVQLSLTTNYVKHWGLNEALRELYQNAIDIQAADEKCKMESTFDEDYSELTIVSKNTILSRQSLLFGASTKNDDDKYIGQFGEGYKLALLVLCRAHYNVFIYTGNEIWTPHIEHSEEFNADVLTIEIEESLEYEPMVTFKIVNISKAEYEAYREKNLHLQYDIVSIATPTCEILLNEEHIGKIFVGGLYVCKFNAKTMHGYNFKPNVFKLGRDRQVIDGFDLTWASSRALVSAAVNDADFAAKLIENIDLTGDNTYLSNFSENAELIQNAAWNKFAKEHPNTVPIKYYSDIENMHKKYKNVTTAIVTEKLYSILVQSENYKNMLMQLELMDEKEEPLSIVNKFYDNYKSMMSDELQQLYIDEILAVAVEWENAK